jgi:acyl carrier protein
VTTTGSLSQEQVFERIRGMLVQLLDEYGIADTEVTLTASFHDDLEFESIDLVTLGGMLQSEYGEAVNLAEFLSEKDLDQVIALRVEDLVGFVVDRLRGAER